MSMSSNSKEKCNFIKIKKDTALEVERKFLVIQYVKYEYWENTTNVGLD